MVRFSGGKSKAEQPIIRNFFTFLNSVCGQAVVKLKELAVEEARELLNNADYQSWHIPESDANKLMESIRDWVNHRTHGSSASRARFTLPGNHPIYDASSSMSGVETHNCVSWCEKQLRAIDIKLGSTWTLAKSPDERVREIIQIHKSKAAPPTI